MKTHLVRGCVILAAAACGCGQPAEDSPPVATPSLSIDREQAPLGSPLEVTYRFVVAEQAPPRERPYRVLVHVQDSDGELMWTDDHDPPIPTASWQPGQTIEYSRTVFVPIYPYIGEVSLLMGLYSTVDDERLPLAGEDDGQRAYRVGTLQLLPQSENVFLIFKEGWHRAEVAPNNAAVEWQWTKQEAILSFRNPQRDALLYLEVDSRSDAFAEPQQVTIAIANQPIASFEVATMERTLQKIPLSADHLGDADMVDLQIQVDETFVPSLLPGTTGGDSRELGIRVFHAFVQPR